MDMETNNIYASQEELPQVQKRENALAGIVGAFLFSLIGGVLYFVVYELGCIAEFAHL